MSNTGYIHSVETFGTVDGPGIRYVLFLQGCPLRCKYCHNRDTWERSLGKEITADEVINEVNKYKRFYERSGGGLTASGGEPTQQPDFVQDLFQKVKQLKLNTALDTSGFADLERVAGLLEWTDLVLLDIKAVDAEQHEYLTGFSNELIIEFADYLQSRKVPVWIRHVLIPGINDDQEHLTLLTEFLKKYDNLQKVELLGYHKLGKHKWQLCAEDDPLADIPAAAEEDIEKARQFLRAKGIKEVR